MLTEMPSSDHHRLERDQTHANLQTHGPTKRAFEAAAIYVEVQGDIIAFHALVHGGRVLCGRAFSAMVDGRGRDDCGCGPEAW